MVARDISKRRFGRLLLSVLRVGIAKFHWGWARVITFRIIALHIEEDSICSLCNLECICELCWLLKCHLHLYLIFQAFDELVDQGLFIWSGWSEFHYSISERGDVLTYTLGLLQSCKFVSEFVLTIYISELSKECTREIGPSRDGGGVTQHMVTPPGHCTTSEQVGCEFELVLVICK